MVNYESTAMISKNMVYALMDNGGRRSLIDRRQFTYAAHIPERRTHADRRSQKDRRVEDQHLPGGRLLNSSTVGRIIPFPIVPSGD